MSSDLDPKLQDKILQELKDDGTMDKFFEGMKPSKPKIHRGPDDTTCTSCEG